MITEWLPDELRAELIAQEHRATGKGMQSISCERTATGYIVRGLGYLYWNQYGRRAGTLPPIDAIRQWVKVKGIPEAAVWPIAMKLKRQGSYKPYIRWTAGNSLNREDFIGRTIERNRERLNKEIAAEWQGVIFEAWQQAIVKETNKEIQI